MKRNFQKLAFLSYDRLESRQLLAADVMMMQTQTVEGSSTPVLEANRNSIPDNVEVSPGTAEAIRSDVVLGWNSLFNDLLVDDADNQNPGYASRSMAILNLAIYDAITVASGDPNDTFYDYSTDLVGSNARISAEAVASQAAYTVLSALYPDQQVSIDAYLDGLTNSRNAREGSASNNLGTVIGTTILEARSNDGFDAVVDYKYKDDIGYFQADPLNPDVPVWGPGWGQVETFSITSASDFLPESTPALDSAEYAASYNEVLELGSVDSATRTADQTEAGIFWAYDREGLGTPIALFSDVLETIAIQEGNTLEENAALYAQASVAMADAGIVAWQSKFSEEFWRPVTAIQQGDNDGNALTEGDEDWTALGAPDGGDDIIGFTPQFPTYVSGHATFGGALFGAIQEFYGTDDIAFDLASTELEILLNNPELQAEYGLQLDDAFRSFGSLSEAMAENGRSRVYLGIHFDFDDLVGQEVGQAVATAVSSEFEVASTDNDRGRDRPDNRRDNDRDRRREGPDNNNRRRRNFIVGQDGSNQSPVQNSLNDNDPLEQVRNVATEPAPLTAAQSVDSPSSDPTQTDSTERELRERRRGDTSAGRQTVRDNSIAVDQVFTDLAVLD